MAAEREPASSSEEPEWSKTNRTRTDLPFFVPSIDNYLGPETRQLLENYSDIPPEEQSEHVHKIRDLAWAIRPYPCTGLGTFLVPFLSYSPAYAAIISRLKSGDTLMDVGCHLGSDLRRLALDGAPSSHLYGVDIVSHWDLGFELYRDKGRFGAHFVEADFTSEDDNCELFALKGRVGIISISALLHQWSWNDQVTAAKKLVAFSKPGSLVVGYQIGNVQGKEVVFPATKRAVWRHDPASFERMWKQVGVETGSSWETKATLRTWESIGQDSESNKFLEKGNMALDFVVERVQ